jgi:CheY-like chemotaxis protein
MKSQRPILLLEDDLIDVMTVKKALGELNISNELINFSNGEDGLTYIQNKAFRLPCIIILDINMPRMTGIEFLQAARRDALLQKTPVIVLTTSKEEKDIVESYKLGVSGYMVKPVDYMKFVNVIREINLYWTLSELPT